MDPVDAHDDAHPAEGSGSTGPSGAVEPPEAAVPPPTLHIVGAAIVEIHRMLAEEDLLDEGGLRIRARSGAGCSAPLQFGLFLEPAPADDDVVLEGKGIRIFMDPGSAWELDGLFIDWVDDPEHGEGFAFRHPRSGGRSC